MSELQEAEATSAEPEVSVTPEVEAASPEQGSESAPDSGENHEEKVTFTEAQQAVINKAVGDKAFKQREAERQVAERDRQIAELQSKIPQEARPNVPDLPDPYNEDYERKMVERDEAIKAGVSFDAQQQVLQQQQQQQQQQQLQQQQEVIVEAAKGYAGRAKALGVSETELQAAGQAIVQYGINDQVATFILNDEQGPLIAKYLAANPVELDRIARLDPMSAAVAISTTVKEKAAALGVKQRNAPDPVETLNGAGVAPSKGGPPGVIYE